MTVKWVAEPDPTMAKPCGGPAEIAADPAALRWAHECGWVPGTGYCRRWPCGDACLFRMHRDGEAARVARARQERRPDHRTGARSTARRPGSLPD